MSGQDQPNSDQDHPEKVGALGNMLERLIDGGLPQVLAGPAGKAISRLIGAGADIPAAWLEQKAQGIRDTTNAKSVLMKTLAAKSAELGASDPALLERGLNNLLSRAYREQENRDTIAKLTIQHLEQEPPSKDSAGPSEDWLNVFEDKASKASSEELQNLFSRILAGEIRKPGSFSLAALHVLSILDRNAATLIEKIAPYVVGGRILKNALPSTVTVNDLVALESIGFLTGSGGTLSVKFMCDAEGHAILGENGWNIRLTYDANREVKFPAYPISQSGNELLAILMIPKDRDSIMRAAWKSKPKEIHRMVPISDDPTRVMLIPISRPADL